MLKLKRVEIHGFKSFYDRTEMKFNGSGIAAVVGPNGCGKSNLSDAISWVLGEQSAKSLRGARMEDVIFAGTREKKPLGMASVTMTLVPDERFFSALHVSVESHKHLSAKAVDAEDHESHAFGHLNGSHDSQSRQAENGTTVVPADDTEDAHKLEQVTTSSDHEGRSAGPPKSEVVKTAEKTGEITITRRLYRSGESEYLINGKIARLRDIQDLFLGTGLGPESYAIIEQGRIGQILSNKPQDRRAIIEEAAGITRFKTKKRLAEAKLESAKQNLSRVFDILEEVNRQVNSLKRQAAKTRRYSELKAESTGFLRELLAARYQALDREKAKLVIELNLASTQLQTAQTAVLEKERVQTELLESSYANERELTGARKELSEFRLRSERAKATLEHQLRQVQQIEARLEAGRQEFESVANQESSAVAERDQQTAHLETLEHECATSKTQLDEKAAERQRAQEKLAQEEQGLEFARQGVLRLLSECSTIKNRLTQAEAQLTSAERDAGRAKAEEQQSDSDRQRIEKLRAELSERLAARQTELISVTDQRKTVEQDLHQHRTRLADARHSVERLRSEFSRVKARRDSVEEVIQHRSYTTETVKRLFTAVERGKAEGFQPLGVLADFLEVDPSIEKAAEEFLHDELEYVIVRNWEEAEQGIELMRREVNGRATFLAETTGQELAVRQDLPVPDPDSENVKPIADSLRLTNGLSKLPWDQLPRISHCFLASDRNAARGLATQYPHCWFLTSDGISYHGHAVSGGKKTGAGPLALKREARELAQIEQAKQREVDAAQAELGSLEHTITKLADQLEHLRVLQQSQEKDVLAIDHESRKLSEDLQRAHSRLSRARLELDRISRDRIKLNESTERDKSALNERETARSSEEERLAAARANLTGLQNVAARAAEEHSALRANLASLEERRRALVVNRDRIENQIRQLQNRQLHLKQETERLTAEREQLQANNVGLEKELGRLTEVIASLEKTVETLAKQEGDFRARMTELDEQLKQVRATVETLHESRSEIQIGLARINSDLSHLEETCQKELASSLQQLVDESDPTREGVELADVESKYSEALRKIEALGPVNPQAVEEFEEAQQRQEFLNVQRQDLLDSIRDTEKTIGDIDSESRKRFGEAFHAINENFREMFRVLFGGGTGEMRLTDEDNLAESGIDIVASPPGKRLQSVLLLSGGEKSLTAMALLMAIFQYTPSPFCVLDEVDAPLDEPNIERLTRLLKDMAQQTQFIVITHSKRTMESAQALYGVTMQEPGVSKLVSVKFKSEQKDRMEQENTLEPAVA